MKRSVSDWLLPLAVGLAFGVTLALFAWQVNAFGRAVCAWARRDLESRATLASATLRDILDGADFRRLHEVGAACTADGLRLTVFSAPGGLVFDTLPHGASAPEALYAQAPCGEYAVRLGLPLARVFAPVRQARLGFLLAALAGGAGVCLVLVFTYRQRVRLAEMRRLEAFRRDFIADVSHEIRTPLTGILGAVDLLKASADDAAARTRLLDIVQRSSVRLNDLAESVLALARLEREDASPSAPKAEEDVAEIVREATEALLPQARAQGVALTCAGCGRPVPFPCDGALVGQAVGNLVVNALRHADSPTVAVSLRAVRRGVEIAVEDRGRGIPSDQRARVFERFYRVGVSGASGSGLGLAIVQRIAERHGGTVALDPAEPSGCRFTLRLNA